MSAAAPPPPQSLRMHAPAPEKTGGFDGKRAYAQVAKQVAFGPRPAGSPALAQTQEYLLAELKSYGCTIESRRLQLGHSCRPHRHEKYLGEDSWRQARRNSPRHPLRHQAPRKFRGRRRRRLFHRRDARTGSHALPAARQYTVWIAFFDGEEAVRSRMAGSRQPLRQPRNGRTLRQQRRPHENKSLPSRRHRRQAAIRTSSAKPTPPKRLNDLVWETAHQLGYQNIFVDTEFRRRRRSPDHFSTRHVPSVDVIDLDNGPNGDVYYWHTPQDTLDKISPKSLAIVGHVFLESVKQLQVEVRVLWHSLQAVLLRPQSKLRYFHCRSEFAERSLYSRLARLLAASCFDADSD